MYYANDGDRINPVMPKPFPHDMYQYHRQTTKSDDIQNHHKAPLS
jgi:hypothetical protein